MQYERVKRLQPVFLAFTIVFGIIEGSLTAYLSESSREESKPWVWKGERGEERSDGEMGREERWDDGEEGRGVLSGSCGGGGGHGQECYRKLTLSREEQQVSRHIAINTRTCRSQCGGSYLFLP